MGYERAGHVPAVPDHVDEPRLRQGSPQVIHLLDVLGRLVAVPRLALSLGVEGVERAHGVRVGRRAGRGQGRCHLRQRQGPQAEEVVRSEQLDQAMRVHPTVRPPDRRAMGTRKWDSGGMAISGCALSMAWRSVVPDRPLATTNGNGDLPISSRVPGLSGRGAIRGHVVARPRGGREPGTDRAHPDRCPGCLRARPPGRRPGPGGRRQPRHAPGVAEPLEEPTGDGLEGRDVLPVHLAAPVAKAQCGRLGDVAVVGRSAETRPSSKYLSMAGS